LRPRNRTGSSGLIEDRLDTRASDARLFKADRLEDARSLATQALAVTREFNQRACEAWARRLVGEIASHGKAPDFATAEDSYRQALTLADELGMRPLVAHCHLGLAKLHRRPDRREQAAEHLDTAATMFREMDMRPWLEQAEASQPALNLGAGRE